MRTNWWAGVLVALLPAPLAAQALAQRVQGAGDGTVRLSFAAREGVCSRGPGSITIMDDDEDHEEWESDCERGPVRVSLRMQGGRVADSETYVGGRWRAGRASGLHEAPKRRRAGAPSGGTQTLDGATRFSLCHVREFVDQYLAQHELRKRILRRFRQEGIEIPFPQRVVHMRDGHGGPMAPTVAWGAAVRREAVP